MKLRSLFRRRGVEREMDAELRFHLDHEIEENIARGMSPADARNAALRSTGSVALIKDECRESLGVRLLDDLRQDVRHGVRALVKHPGFTITAVLTLALGIGANTAIFTLVDAVMLKPLPVRAPDELVTLFENGPEGAADPAGGTGRFLRFSYPRFLRLRQALGSDGVLAAGIRSSEFSYKRADGSPLSIRAQLVSGEYFSTLGIEAARGRTITESDLSDRAPVAVVSDTFWRRRLGAREDVVGATIVINGEPLTVVGVAPPGFAGLWTDAESELWMPLTLQAFLHYENNSSSYDGGTAGAPWPTRDGLAWLNVFGRVPGPARGTAIARLQAANRAGLADLAATFTTDTSRSQMLAHTLAVEPFAQGFSGLRARYSDALIVLVVMVGIVLVITCVNIASLLLVRSIGDARDVGIRLSLGASTGRLMRQQLTQSLLLSSLGGGAGFLVGEWASDLLARAVLGTSGALPVVFAPDRRVLVFTAVVSLGTAVLFGVAPALKAIHAGRAAALGANQRSSINGSAVRGLGPLVSAQIALSVVVVFAAVLLGRTLANFLRLDLGFDADRIVSMSFDPLAAGYTADTLPALGERLVAAARTVPGVMSASVSRCGLIAGCTSSGGFTIGDVEGKGFYRNWVGPDYFSTTGIAMIAGREFNEGDSATGPRVAIISESVARVYFPNQNPLGQHIGFASRDTEVVGVVRDARSISVHDAPVSMVYLPIGQAAAQASSRVFNVDVRVGGKAGAAATAIRDAIRKAEPPLSAVTATTMSQRIERDVTRERVVAYLSASFAGLAIFLASLGLYGVLSFGVARRTKEIGVRMALGARASEVVRMVLGQSVVLTSMGLLAGLGGASLAAQYLKGLLFGLPPLAPSAFVGAAAVFAAVALLASYLPARRAARVDPLVALRCE